MYSDYTKARRIPKANLLVSQFQSENETWKRTLEFLTGEDVNLEVLLSEILKNMGQPDDSLLERIEHFHNRLLKENETRGFLRLEVTEVEKQLSQDFSDDTDWLKEIQNRQKKLRKDMETAELQFHKLKFDFNNNISEIL